MASAPQIAANRSNARAPHAPGGASVSRADPAKIVHWESRANLSNEISERHAAERQFHAAGNRSGSYRLAQRSRARYQVIAWRASQGLPEMKGSEGKLRSAKIVFPSGEPRIRWAAFWPR